MENASKALIMAGSILMSILVIGVLTIAYNQMSIAEQERINAEEAGKVVDYVKQFEQYKYHKTIYGTELLSLGNLKLDYNRMQAELKTYDPIEITAVFNNDIAVEGEPPYINRGEQTIEKISDGIRRLENDIAYYEKQENGKVASKDRIKRSIKSYAQYNNRQLADLFGITFSSDDPESVIKKKLEGNRDTSEIMQKVDKYKVLKTLLTEFKRKQFRALRMKDGDTTGRIERMEYLEI